MGAVAGILITAAIGMETIITVTTITVTTIIDLFKTA
jgi:hypothetical protein